MKHSRVTGGSFVGVLSPLAAIVVSLSTGAAFGQASFQGLGDLPGGSFYSEPDAVSADGAVVVGQSNSASGAEAFRWTSGGEMVGLGGLPGGNSSTRAWAVSADGSVVVGNGSTVSARGISPDGLTIVGDGAASLDAVAVNGGGARGSSAQAGPNGSEGLRIPRNQSIVAATDFRE